MLEPPAECLWTELALVGHLLCVDNQVVQIPAVDVIDFRAMWTTEGTLVRVTFSLCPSSLSLRAAAIVHFFILVVQGVLFVGFLLLNLLVLRSLHVNRQNVRVDLGGSVKNPVANRTFGRLK